MKRPTFTTDVLLTAYKSLSLEERIVIDRIAEILCDSLPHNKRTRFGRISQLDVIASLGVWMNEESDVRESTL